ncbi:hypothetical protein HC928_11255, partial [bacterium]|nr:hypothetical protein [bacterium]
LAPKSNCRPAPGFDGAPLRHQLYTLALTQHRAIYRNAYQRPALHTLANRAGELWSPLVALAAFFEEEGQVAGLLGEIHQAAERDTLLSVGTALNERDTALLQALEVLTREATEPQELAARDLRQQVAKLLDLPEDQLGAAQWIGHSLKQLHLTDAGRKRNPGHWDCVRDAARRRCWTHETLQCGVDPRLANHE